MIDTGANWLKNNSFVLLVNQILRGFVNQNNVEKASEFFQKVYLDNAAQMQTKSLSDSAYRESCIANLQYLIEVLTNSFKVEQAVKLLSTTESALNYTIPNQNVYLLLIKHFIKTNDSSSAIAMLQKMVHDCPVQPGQASLNALLDCAAIHHSYSIMHIIYAEI